MTTPGDRELLTLVERFFTAYNDMDLDTFGSLLADDVHFEHHNRFRGQGREPLLASVRDIESKMPDRRFGKVTRWAVHGDTVYAEHGWQATPVITEPSWGWQAGVPTSMDVVSVFVFDGGRIKEWSDYG